MKVLFHYPGPFYDELDTGEKKRPRRMYEAFSKLACEVTAIVGNYKERRCLFEKNCDHFSKFDFLYSENSTLPLGLTGKHHFPRINSVDHKLFIEAKAAGLPCGVYYRDLYWKFSDFSQEVNPFKLALAKPFYQRELNLYSQTVSALFVQSPEFGKIIPFTPREKIVELPPGGDLKPLSLYPKFPPLRLVYVGSVRPPFYDVSQLFSVMMLIEDLPIEINLVTPKNDWDDCKNYYSSPKNLKVHHESGENLSKVLKGSHISIQAYNDQPYRAIVLPLKLFEAITFGLPIITIGKTATSRFVCENDFGWNLDSTPESCVILLKYLLSNPWEIDEKVQYIRGCRHHHSWEARARRAIEVLIGS